MNPNTAFLVNFALVTKQLTLSTFLTFNEKKCLTT